MNFSKRKFRHQKLINTINFFIVRGIFNDISLSFGHECKNTLKDATQSPVKKMIICKCLADSDNILQYNQLY